MGVNVFPSKRDALQATCQRCWESVEACGSYEVREFHPNGGVKTWWAVVPLHVECGTVEDIGDVEGRT